jgi:hypothetical protein
MVQAMEAWFIADIDTLKKFYGQGFRETSIPRNLNVEKIDKDSLEPSLKEATRNTVKGEYQKIQHASELLELLNVTKCERLLTTAIASLPPLPKLWERQSDKAMCSMKGYAIAQTSI